MRQPLLEEEDPVYLRFWASYSSECVPVWMPVAWPEKQTIIMISEQPKMNGAR